MQTTFEELRAREYSRLDNSGHAYLDYTGSGLYAESQIRHYSELLLNRVFGNPHSINPSSLESTKFVEEARDRIRGFFEAEGYDVIFTLNATGALKLVGESYPFDNKSHFVLTADNHNSVNGIREFARAKKATTRYIPLNSKLRVDSIDDYIPNIDSKTPGLFAYPAQSNFSGVKHPLEWVKKAHTNGYDVLLDAAAYVPSNRLSLKEVQADFVPISFYKMFGFPTGVGALLARHDALRKLRRPWFGGGTIRYVSTANNVHLLQTGSEGFEDGTVNFLGILAISQGLDFLDSIGMDEVSEHVARLTKLMLSELKSLRHSNGEPLIRIYGPDTTENRGGTVAFNVLSIDGKEISSDKVADVARTSNISVRTGCFCNPGASEFAFEYEPKKTNDCFNSISREKFTLQDFSTCIGGKPVGAVRASLGIASNEHDITRLIGMLRQFKDTTSRQVLHRTRDMELAEFDCG